MLSLACPFRLYGYNHSGRAMDHRGLRCLAMTQKPEYGGFSVDTLAGLAAGRLADTVADMGEGKIADTVDTTADTVVDTRLDPQKEGKGEDNLDL
jgi:hypothetical protein